MNPVAGVSGETEVFSGAGRADLGLVEQIAPRVVRVGVAPEFLVTAEHVDRAVGSGILGGDEAVQRVIGESLVASGVFVIGDAKDVTVVRARCTVAHVEVISDREHSLAGRVGRHVYRLKAFVVSERVVNPGKACAVAADKAGQSAVRAISGAGDVNDVVAAVLGGKRQVPRRRAHRLQRFRWGNAAFSASHQNIAPPVPVFIKKTLAHDFRYGFSCFLADERSFVSQKLFQMK